MLATIAFSSIVCVAFWWCSVVFVCWVLGFYALLPKGIFEVALSVEARKIPTETLSSNRSHSCTASPQTLNFTLKPCTLKPESFDARIPKTLKP